MEPSSLPPVTPLTQSIQSAPEQPVAPPTIAQLPQTTIPPMPKKKTIVLPAIIVIIVLIIIGSGIYAMSVKKHTVATKSQKVNIANNSGITLASKIGDVNIKYVTIPIG